MNTSSTTGVMAHKSVDVSVSKSPLLRRTSDTERVIGVMLDGSRHELSRTQEEESSSSFPSSFSVGGIMSALQHTIDDFSEMAQEEMRIIEEEEEEARQQQRRHAEVLGQKRHVRKNAKIILKDDVKFREFQKAIKQTGMLTSNGVKQVLLSPTVEENQRTSHTRTHNVKRPCQ